MPTWLIVVLILGGVCALNVAVMMLFPSAGPLGAAFTIITALSAGQACAAVLITRRRR